jgi:hypothetical protein
MVIKKSSATWNLREKVDNPSLFNLEPHQIVAVLSILENWLV